MDRLLEVEHCRPVYFYYVQSVISYDIIAEQDFQKRPPPGDIYLADTFPWEVISATLCMRVSPTFLDAQTFSSVRKISGHIS